MIGINCVVTEKLCRDRDSMSRQTLDSIATLHCWFLVSVPIGVFLQLMCSPSFRGTRDRKAPILWRLPLVLIDL